MFHLPHICGVLGFWGFGGSGAGYDGPGGGFSGSRRSGKPRLLLRLKKTPPGPQKPLPGPRGPPRGSFYGLSIMGCKCFSDLWPKNCPRATQENAYNL